MNYHGLTLFLNPIDDKQVGFIKALPWVTSVQRAGLNGERKITWEATVTTENEMKKLTSRIEQCGGVRNSAITMYNTFSDK